MTDRTEDFLARLRYFNEMGSEMGTLTEEELQASHSAETKLKESIEQCRVAKTSVEAAEAALAETYKELMRAQMACRFAQQQAETLAVELIRQVEAKPEVRNEVKVGLRGMFDLTSDQRLAPVVQHLNTVATKAEAASQTMATAPNRPEREAKPAGFWSNFFTVGPSEKDESYQVLKVVTTETETETTPRSKFNPFTTGRSRRAA